jgi:hypothetical protein
MEALEAGLFSLQHEKYLIETYTPLCVAAGYSAENLRLLAGPDVYFLATAIMGAVKSRAAYVVEGAFGHVDYTGALKSMSLRELRELRERIAYLPHGRLPANVSIAVTGKQDQ